ncbi:response regulator [Buchananella hordeovulneris]|uniref:DNA-binding response regulator n=1 Tax=Buchananella hordeovulneris TaxID=52770 RepID=A0A1Q5PVL1_9ACTO|nr:response regulator transcription factor [Buchananella hordeovulneris]OKL51512.1 DNA-binding response regulator [Buchananella hordeovulneris]RRD44103.1 DNA-binding response regulator [Buchananella hordeovulneris]RRD53664.1 DNA-binding response regulator [Buchananella hordeovulneris]
MIQVVLVDDQAVVRAGFKVLLESEPDIQVVGEASGGHQALQIVRRTNPDVVCMDLRMPAGDGLEATRRLVAERQNEKPAVLVVTTFDLDADVFGALEAGADGFILKDCEPEELVTAVRRLAAGFGLVDQAVTKRVIAEFARRQPAQLPTEPAHHLTPREQDIITLLARGMSNAEIAAELVLEISTVKSHLTRLLPKIGARDRVQAVIWAHRHGLG